MNLTRWFLFLRDATIVRKLQMNINCFEPKLRFLFKKQPLSLYCCDFHEAYIKNEVGMRFWIEENNKKKKMLKLTLLIVFFWVSKVVLEKVFHFAKGKRDFENSVGYGIEKYKNFNWYMLLLNYFFFWRNICVELFGRKSFNFKLYAAVTFSQMKNINSNTYF